MRVYTFSEARQNFASVLELAQKEGVVRINRRDGKSFIIKSVEDSDSPLNIKGVDLNPHFSPPIYCDSPMVRATRLSLGRAAQQSVDHACAALGRESRVSRTLEPPRYERV